MKGVIFLLLMALLTFIPYGMQRYGLLATYLAPVKPFVFGARVRGLPPEVRKTGTNGVVVDAVAKDSPAFRNDISEGDIVRSIGNIEVCDADSFFAALYRFSGRKITFEIVRDGKSLQREVRLQVKGG